MKRSLLAIAVFLAAPASAQPGATELEVMGGALIDRWIVAFNRNDADAMAADVYVDADKAKLSAMFADLQDESFGKLDAYSVAFCNYNSTKGRALLKFTRLYTFGGKMNDDEAQVFELVKTDGGWRIADEADAPFSTVLSCS